MLRIEFSAMKLINQPSNNLEEVCDEDFETIVKTLQKRISELGARVSPESIRKAKVMPPFLFRVTFKQFSL